MPVLVNSDSGLAEELPQDQADAALSAGTHQLPLNDTEGNPVTGSLADAPNLMSQGYSQPSPDQLNNLLNYAHYSSNPEIAKTAAEGAAQAMTFGLSTGAERLMGIDPESIRARQEVNPGSHMLGEAAGLGASAFIPGVGEANLIGKVGGAVGKVGEAVTGALGLGGAGLLSRVGSSVVKNAAKNAVETALVSGGDEVSKMLASDPHQSAETALTDIGLNALLGGALGGAFGTVSPLWKAAKETQVGKFLSAITDKANGLERDALPSPEITSAADKAGIYIPNEVKSGLSENPEARNWFQLLQESTTKSGKEAQQSFQQFKSEVNKGIVSAVGKTPEDLEAISGMSDYDSGAKIKESLISEIKAKTDPLADDFKRIQDKYAGAEVNEAEKADIANEINNLVDKQGYGLLKGTQQGGLIGKILDSLPEVKTLEDLRKFQTQIQEQTQNPEMWGLGKGLKTILRDSEESMVMKRLGEEAPDLIGQHQAARAAYRDAMDTIDSLNDRLHVGRYAGPGSFVKTLGEMAPEDVLRRITPRNDAGLLDLVSSKFPETTAHIKDSYLNQVLKQASGKAVGENIINPKTMLNGVNQWSPELKEFALPEGAAGKLSGIEGLLKAIPDRMNPSGTAKTLDALWQKLPGGIGGAVGAIMGHNPVMGYVLGQLGQYVGREVPDAIKLATLKFLGSDVPINSSAFKVLAEIMSSTYKGNGYLTNGVKNLFKAGAQVLPQAADPKHQDIEKLKKHVDHFNANQTALLNIGGDTGYYLPDHGQAFGAVSTRAIQYLAGIKPKTDPLGPLDSPQKPSQVEESRYNRALSVAEQPLQVLSHIKNGSLTTQDVQTVKSIYPNLYNHMNQQMMNELINHTSKGNKIPYTTRLSMSMFMGQPLDATMTPQAIQMAQPKAPLGQQAQIQAPKGKGSMKDLGKFAQMSQTNLQAGEAKHLGKG